MSTPLYPEPKPAAIILAAGYSSRMGQFKPLLSLGTDTGTAIEATIHVFLSAGIENVLVVVGHRADELAPIVEAAGARAVLNPNFDQGMFSSVRAGAAALLLDSPLDAATPSETPSAIQACFITPADIPLVRPATIRRLARALTNAATPAPAIVYPLFAQRRGHPVLISRAILRQVLDAPSDARLSTLLAAHDVHDVQQALDLFVPDQAILMDMDTPSDLARLRALAELRAAHPELPTPAETEAILAFYQPDERVIRHTHLVAQVAHRIASALASDDPARGVSISPALVECAALLHDVLKRTAAAQPDHATAAAELLRQLEFPSVAAVVALHTDYPLPAASAPPDEAAIVYLADKLVSGERIVGLDQRFRPALERFQHNSEALAAARRRQATAEAVLHQVEAHLGTALSPLIASINRNSSAIDSGAPNSPPEADATHLSRP